MSDIPSFPYADLWNERQVMSVANLTRQDGDEFFPLAQKANVALDDLRAGRLKGAAVLLP